MDPFLGLLWAALQAAAGEIGRWFTRWACRFRRRGRPLPPPGPTPGVDESARLTNAERSVLDLVAELRPFRNQEDP